MITNFEEITKELTEYELSIVVPMVISGLKTKIGKKNVISNKKMIKGLKENMNIKVSEPRIRKIIQYIRLSGTIKYLIATSKGYYIATNRKELEDYLESLYQRIASIETTAKQISYQLETFSE